jgi:ribosomal protein S18 acetylase RimI-like enzyme
VAKFPLIDQYFTAMLDIDISGLKPDAPAVTESLRRLQCEQSYGFVHALYAIFFEDARTAISVPPGSLASVMHVLNDKPADVGNRFDPAWLENLAACISRDRVQAGLPPVRSTFESKLFACNAALLQRHHYGGCQQLRDERITPACGLSLPMHCFPNGIVYGIVADEQIVSVAYAHQSGRMENQVVDLGVETAEAYRKRGYAKTVVSAVTAHMTESGGEAVYTCSASNLASIATARSVGYELYGRIIAITAPTPSG